jgi:hypothetical protein
MTIDRPRFLRSSDVTTTCAEYPSSAVRTWYGLSRSVCCSPSAGPCVGSFEVVTLGTSLGSLLDT